MKECLSKIVEAAGVAGAGGAGFPTHIKLRGKADLVIANGCECEPLLASDAWLMENRPRAVLAGLESARKAVAAEAGVIAVKAKNREACRAVEAALKRYPRLSLKRIDDFFPAGDEQVLTRIVTGKIIPPGGIPLQVGVVVNNVATLYNVQRAKAGFAVTDKLLTVGGAVRSPYVAEVPVGTLFGELIKAAGGPKWGSAELDYSTNDTGKYRFVVIDGGPMMGRVVSDLTLPVEKTTGGLILLPEDHPLVIQKTGSYSNRYNRITCCACDECTGCCPRNMLGHPIFPHKIARGYATGKETGNFTGAFLCCECGLCQYYACTMGVSPMVINREIKRSVSRPEGFPGLRETESVGNRKPVSSKRLINRLDLTEYVAKAPFRKLPAPARVHIPLKGRFGTRAVPVVASGDKVVKGDKIARIRSGKTGTAVHAPINGEVKEASPGRIVIENERYE
ncbi:MAG: 4Fe-4S dicluster domain-containing protein [bacterium]